MTRFADVRGAYLRSPRPWNDWCNQHGWHDVVRVTDLGDGTVELTERIPDDPVTLRKRVVRVELPDGVEWDDE